TNCVRLDEAEVSIHAQDRARPYNCRTRRHSYGQSILRHRPRASGSFKPTTFAEGLRCVGNSSGNEIGSGPVASHFFLAERRARDAESPYMNPRKTIIAVLSALSASFALADDFKTINGKEYKDITVTRVEPDGIVLKGKSGIT